MRMYLCVLTVMLLAAGATRAELPTLQATAAAHVERLRQRASSPDNGWKQISFFFPTKGEPRRAEVDQVLKAGDELYERL